MPAVPKQTTLSGVDPAVEQAAAELNGLRERPKRQVTPSDLIGRVIERLTAIARDINRINPNMHPIEYGTKEGWELSVREAMRMLEPLRGR